MTVVDVVEFFVGWEAAVEELLDSGFVRVAKFVDCAFVRFPTYRVCDVVLPFFSLCYVRFKSFAECVA